MSDAIDPRISFLGDVSSGAHDDVLATLQYTQIVITADAPILATAAGQTIVYQLATLAARLFDQITLEGDETTSALPALPMLSGRCLEAIRAICAELRPLARHDTVHQLIRVRIGSGPADAQLYVGATSWSALISPALPRLVDDTPCLVGALAAGTLAAAEVFKLVFGHRIAHAVLAHEYRVSMLTYADDPEPEPVPASPLPIDVVLYGAGSIGTGFGHALAFAPQLRGRLTIVDNGRFDCKNPYKYSLLDWDSAASGLEKAPWLAQRLQQLTGGRWLITALVGTAEQYVASLPQDYRIAVAISAVDTVEARFEIQDTLPARIINAGIVGTTAEISVHGFGFGPCLACIGLDTALESWQAIPLANALGLDPSRVHDLIRGNAPLEQADLEHLQAADRLPRDIAASLATFLGQPLLSLWNRAAYSDAALQVAVPGAAARVSTAFVSAFAGVLLLGELYKLADPALSGYLVDNSYRQDLVGVPAGNTFRYARDTRGWCLCRSSFRLAVYERKYGTAARDT